MITHQECFVQHTDLKCKLTERDKDNNYEAQLLRSREMSLSMSQASLPVFTRMLGNLSAILAKAAAHAEAKKIDPLVFTGARLAPDMFPLTRQVQIATDVIKGCAARLAGMDAPVYEDREVTFDELQARIRKTVEFLKTIKANQIDGSEERPIALKVGGHDLKFTGQEYLLYFALPNVYFHIAATYAILRHNGVEIGKIDFLGQP